MVIHSCKMCAYENECALKPTSNVVKDCSLFVKKSKQTNAERIRAMSDEELAEFIASISDHCLAGIGAVDCSNMQNCDGCKNVTLEWLKSEVKE